MKKLALFTLIFVLSFTVTGCFFTKSASNVTVPNPTDQTTNNDEANDDGQEAQAEDNTATTTNDTTKDDGTTVKEKPPVVASQTVFNITGANFAFSQKEIKVKKGATVTINFTATSGFHDLVVDEFNAATKQIKEGELTSVTFVADKAGTFEYYCSVGSHRAMGMVGKLIVE